MNLFYRARDVCATICIAFFTRRFKKMAKVAYNTTKERYTNYDLLFCVYNTYIAQTFNLKPTTLSTLTCLCTYYNPSTGVVYPSIQTIAKKINAGKRSVSRSIDELINKGLILRTQKGTHNVYIFGNIFWEYIKKPAQKSNQVTRQKIKNTCQNGNLIHAKMACEQNKHEQNNKYHHKDHLTHNKNDDDFNNNFIEYKCVSSKLEKWAFTGAKFAIKKYGLQKIKKLIELVENKNPVNKGAYLRTLLLTPDGFIHENNKIDLKASESSMIESMLKYQYWKHIPSSKTLKVKPDIGQHLLIKYHKQENMVMFLENGLIDKLENFEPVN